MSGDSGKSTRLHRAASKLSRLEVARLRMRKETRDTPIPSVERSGVKKGGDEPPGLLGEPRRSVATSIRKWPQRVFVCAVVVIVVCVAFALRAFHLDVSLDVFIDEIYYLRISQGVLRTLWVVVDGEPFYLHPPGLFFLEAAYIKLLGIGGDLIHQIYGVRYLGAAFGGLSAGALLWLGRRLAGWPAGIAAAAIFALDPFSIRTNSRNMLDTPTVLWVLLGFVVLFSALEGRRPVSWRRTVAAGVLFGLALLTKEVSVFVTLLPLAICFVLGWALPRTRSTLVGVIALVVYAPYWVIVYAIGDWATFVHQKFDGVSRLAGLLQITGFNQPGGPSLVDAIVSRLDDFATTYVFLATGAVALCVLLLTDMGKVPANRLLMAWTSSAYVFLGYAVTVGTLEEQFFYYLVVPSILATTVTTVLVLRKVRAGDAGSRSTGATWHARDGRRGRLALEVAVAVFVVGLTFWCSYVWVVSHIVPDNAYQRAVSYVKELPEGSRVAVTEETGELLMEEHAGGGIYGSVEALQADNVDYVVISSYLATEGYETPPLEVYQWVTDHGRLVYGFEYRSSGFLGIWRLQDRLEGDTPAPEERHEQERSVDSHRLEPAPIAQVGPSSDRGVSEESP